MFGNGFYRALIRWYVPEQLSAESIRRFAQVVRNATRISEVNLEGQFVKRDVFEPTVLRTWMPPR